MRRYRLLLATDHPSYLMLELQFDTLSEAEALNASLGVVEFDSASEAEAVRALQEPSTPPELTHGLGVRINEVLETKDC